MDQFLTTVAPNPSAEQVIILIPDIWGLTDYNQATARALANDYRRPCYILDYFYQLTNQPSKFDPNLDSQTAPGLMEKMRGEDFMETFSKAVSAIKANQSKLKSIQVVGFCFGGRLAYLAGLDKTVDQIVSFYGAGALKPGFYQDKNVIEALCEARSDDQNLQVLSFFGNQDQSPSPTIVNEFEANMNKAGKKITVNRYEAGHGFSNPSNPSFNAAAREDSYNKAIAFLKSH